MKQRNVGLDILRILLALMVIAIHFNAPATGCVAKSVTGSMKYLVYPMVSLCYPAVNTYVIISGFFGYSKRKTYKQVIFSLTKLWLCLLFFSLLGYAIALLSNEVVFNILDLGKHFFPLSRGVWWYMTVYFVLLLISPALNVIIDRLSGKEYCLNMFLALMICSIIPFFLKFESTIGLNYGSGLIWFVILYITGGGISKYCLKRNNDRHVEYALLIYLCFTFYLLVSPLIYNAIGLKGYTSAMYNSIIVYGQAISLFFIFWNINIKSERLSKCISFMAGLSLAAYVFHCQEDIGRMLWSITEPAKYADSLYLIPLFLYVVFGVYLVATLIEYIRKRLFSSESESKFITRFIDCSINTFDNIYNQLFKRDIQ